MAKIAFIQNFWSEYIGLMSISSLLKTKGHTTKAFVGTKKRIIKEVRKFKPQVVGFTCFTGQHRWILDVCKNLKEALPKNCLFIVGGPHPTFFPENVINKPGVDAICIGESDLTVLELITEFLNRNMERFIRIAGIWVKFEEKVYKNNLPRLIDNLDSLPFADRQLYRDNSFIINNSCKTVITGRGCPFHCSFCFSKPQRELYGKDSKFVRLRSAENIIEEMRMIKSAYHVERFEFADDTFSLNKKWLFEFLNLYRKDLGIPFLCNIRADITDEDIVKELKASGCYRVSFGVETGDDEYRNKILKKNISSEQIYRTARLLYKYKLDFETTNMIGLPAETLDSAVETLRFNLKISTPSVWCSLWQPFMGTELAEYALKNHYIDDLGPDSTSDNLHTHSPTKQKDIDKIVLFHKFFYIFYRFPSLLRFKKLFLKGRYTFLHDYIYRACFMWFYYMRKYRLSFNRMVKEAYIALRYY